MADAPTQPSPIFQASLGGDLETVRTHLADKDARTPEGYAPLGLAVSAGRNAVVRLLLREGADVNVGDAQGVTALMHAAMHGYADLIDLMLLHGARPMQQQHDGRAAPGLAALFGRPAAIGAFLRADPTLLTAKDGCGRTLLHWAVASQHVPTLKYLLGRWDGGALLEEVDAVGDTPLHVCRGPPVLLLLLYLGGPKPPSLTSRSHAGHTAAEAADAAGCNEVASLLQAAADSPADNWLDRNAASEASTELLSFLSSSRRRAPPACAPRPAWCHALRCGALLRAGWCFGLLLLLCASPPATAAVASAAVLLCPLASCVARAPPVLRAFAWAGCGGGDTDGDPREQLPPPSKTVPPLLLLLGVCCLLTLHASLLLPLALSRAPSVAAASIACELVLVVSYLKVLVADPGMVAGGNPADAALYWEAIEKLPPGAGAVARREGPSMYDGRPPSSPADPPPPRAWQGCPRPSATAPS